MKSYLLLSDGTKFEGELHGDHSFAVGEIVFNTGMTGYQEIVTDPSYYDQIVVMTYPMIGNYGTESAVVQSERVQVKGLIVDHICLENKAFMDYLNGQNIPLMTGVDTRALTKYIRDKGSMQSQFVVDVEKPFENSSLEPVYEVATKRAYEIGRGQYKLAVLDFGIKKGILKQLEQMDFQMKVFPGYASAEEIESYKPDALFLSNGPGNPENLKEIITTVEKLVKNYPTFGICLGHQLIAHAFGMKTEKLKFGHRGSNHPVVFNNKVMITSQNHSYKIEDQSFNERAFLKTYTHVNDGSIEGMAHKTLPLFSVQFHPEASPGPTDSHLLFKSFEKMVKEVCHA